MANRIQIRHGTSKPTADDLLPYELGWYNGTLYINDGDTTSGHDPIQAIGGKEFAEQIKREIQNLEN